MRKRSHIPRYAAILIAIILLVATLAACTATDPTPDALTVEPTFEVTIEIAPSIEPTDASTHEAPIEITLEPTAEPTPLPLIPVVIGTYADFIGAPLPPGAIERIGLGEIVTSALSPGGSLFAVGTNTQIAVLDASTLDMLWKATIPQEAMGLAWSVDGLQLAVWLESDVRLVLFDGISGAVIRISSFPEPVRAAAWSPDGALLAVLYGFANPNNEVEAVSEVVFFDKTGSITKTFRLPRPIFSPYSIQGAAFEWSQDGRLIGVAAQSGVFVWDTVTGDVLLDQEEGMQVLAFSPQGTMLAGAEGKVLAGHQATLWDLVNNTSRTLSHTENVFITDFAWSSDGTMLSSIANHEYPGGGPVEIYLWDAATGEVLQRFENESGYLGDVQWLNDTRLAAVGFSYVSSEDAGLDRLGSIYVWDATSGSLLTHLSSADDQRWFGWLNEYTQVISAGERRVSLWDAASGEVLSTISTQVLLHEMIWSDDGTHLVPRPDPLSAPHYFDDPAPVTSPDGKFVAVPQQGQVVILDAATRDIVRTLDGQSEKIEIVAWSPDGSMLAAGEGTRKGGEVPVCGGLDGDEVLVWDTTTGDLLHRFVGHRCWVWTLQWSPDGTRLASGSWEYTILIWDIAGVLP